MRFEVDGMLIGSGPVTLVDGQATSAEITMMSPGTHQVLAIYLGSSGVAPSADGLWESFQEWFVHWNPGATP